MRGDLLYNIAIWPYYLSNKLKITTYKKNYNVLTYQKNHTI